MRSLSKHETSQLVKDALLDHRTIAHRYYIRMRLPIDKPPINNLYIAPMYLLQLN